MLKEFLSQVRDQVSTNIEKSIGKTNPIEVAMSYSALSESKMIRAGLIFASGKINENISKNSLITLASAIELMRTDITILSFGFMLITPPTLHDILLNHLVF